MNTAKTSPAYECHNPSFNDMNIEEQIEAGINDWRADGISGHPYYGRSKEQAEFIRFQHNDA